MKFISEMHREEKTPKLSTLHSRKVREAGFTAEYVGTITGACFIRYWQLSLNGKVIRERIDSSSICQFCNGWTAACEHIGFTAR